MHNHSRILIGLTKTSCELCCFDDGALWNLFARWVTHYDVRSRIITGVHPEIIRLGYAKSEIVVVARGASHQNLVCRLLLEKKKAAELFSFRRSVRSWT